MEIIPASPAPEFKGIKGWANSDPISIKNLAGKVVLLDCWTYTCIFCLRTIPIIKRLQQKYHKYGFQVIQAHSAEYQFAKEVSNIKKALDIYNIRDIPVAFDVENKTWEAYGNMYWPKHILIDSNGFVRFEHAGYGNIQEFEDAVVELIEESGQKPQEGRDTKNPADDIFDTYGMHFYGIAPEICVGYTRLQKFGNNQTLRPDEPNVVIDNQPHADNQVYLRGKWIWEKEGLRYSQGGKEKNPAIIMKYNSARRVHAIMSMSDGKTAMAEIKIDGNHIPIKNAGKDVKVDEAGRSICLIEWPFIHNLFKTEKPEIHEIEIIPRSDNFVFNTFVFG